jgi:hypothetical protein
MLNNDFHPYRLFKLFDSNISKSFSFGSCISWRIIPILPPLKTNYWIWLRTSTSRPFGRDNTYWDYVFSYVKFYLDLVASSENISLLYHLSQKGKTVRDPESHTQSVVSLVLCLLFLMFLQLCYVSELLHHVRDRADFDQRSCASPFMAAVKLSRES